MMKMPKYSVLVATDSGHSGDRTMSFLDVSMIDAAFGARLRNARRKKGLSRQATSDRSGDRVSAEDVRVAEQRPWELPIGKLAAIISALGVEPYMLTESVPVCFSYTHDGTD
jgi:ribosome-binding protein aMBF1 (putative translation factor)